MPRPRTHLLILTIAVLAYVALFTWLGAVKLDRLRYTGLDFAIFHQTIAETARGNLFGSTIHPPSYLADHTSPLLLPIALVYRFFPYPLTLLVLLNLALVLGVFPVWAIARRHLPPAWALPAALGYLVVPFLHTLSLFEFHLIAFAATPLLWAWLEYERGRWGWFWVAAILAMSVREDVGLVVATVGVAALLQRRSWRWVWGPLLVGLAATGLGIWLPRLWGIGERYQYGIYYAWLGQGVVSPLGHLARLASWGNLGFLAAALLPYAGLPLAGTAALLLTLPAYAQLFLGAPGISPLVLQLQYSALLLPGLTVAAVVGLGRVLRATATPKTTITRSLAHNPGLLPLVTVVALGYSALTLGPLAGTLRLALAAPTDPSLRSDRALLARIPADAPVVASYRYLMPLSARPQVQALNYVLLGSRQFNAGPYPPPPANAAWALDSDDALTFEAQFRDHPLYAPAYASGATRLRRLLRAADARVAWAEDGRLLLGPAGEPLDALWQVFADAPAARPTAAFGELELLGLERGAGPDVTLKLHWRLTRATPQRFHLRLTAWRNGVVAYQRIWPMAYGLYPTTDWQPRTVVMTQAHFNPGAQLPPGAYALALEVVTMRRGHLELAADAKPQLVAEYTPVGSPLDLGAFAVAATPRR